MVQETVDKVLAGERISGDEFLRLYAEADLYQLGFGADAIRRKKHPEPVVTYVIDRNINYTDICISACKFCAFFKAPEDAGGML
ncbi:MAG TPA: dehypoxanthine futalosine cyclase, partial [Desulfobulbus sp.]|nr:dehypoxanthine futalosine cyclase [Desulfobulbus sp.]